MIGDRWRARLAGDRPSGGVRGATKTRGDHPGAARPRARHPPRPRGPSGPVSPGTGRAAAASRRRAGATSVDPQRHRHRGDRPGLGAGVAVRHARADRRRSLNFVPGQIAANAVAVKLGSRRCGVPVDLRARAPRRRPDRVVHGHDRLHRHDAEPDPRHPRDGRPVARRRRAPPRASPASAGVPGSAAAFAALNLTVVSRRSPAGWWPTPCGSPTHVVHRELHGRRDRRQPDVRRRWPAATSACSSYGPTDLVVDTYGWSAGTGDLQRPVAAAPGGHAHAGAPASCTPASAIDLRVAGVGGVPNTAAGALLTVTVGRHRRLRLRHRLAVRPAAADRVDDQHLARAAALQPGDGQAVADRRHGLPAAVHVGRHLARPRRRRGRLDQRQRSRRDAAAGADPAAADGPLATPSPVGALRTLPWPHPAERRPVRRRGAPPPRSARTTPGTTPPVARRRQSGWYARVTGNFTGTTDQIIQWAACKWGIDEDIVRAQAAKESGWHQTRRRRLARRASAPPARRRNGSLLRRLGRDHAGALHGPRDGVPVGADVDGVQPRRRPRGHPLVLRGPRDVAEPVTSAVATTPAATCGAASACGSPAAGTHGNADYLAVVQDYLDRRVWASRTSSTGDGSLGAGRAPSGRADVVEALAEVPAVALGSVAS